MSQRVLMIMMSLPEDAPYVSYYQYFIKPTDAEIDYIIWERDRSSEKNTSNYFVFKKRSLIIKNPIVKYFDMLSFGEFANNIIKSKEYSKIIIFSIQCAIFLWKSLKRLPGKYIIDIRDYSPILKLAIFRKRFERIVRNSFATVISSPGFTAFLPNEYNYIISHNIHPNTLEDFSIRTNKPTYPYKVLTIGQLRDKESNSAIIRALGNHPDFTMQFAGIGLAVDTLKEVVKLDNYHNVLFTGYYLKRDESSIVDSCSILNAYMPNNLNSSVLISNRLYLSVINGKPLLVNYDSLQGKIVKQFSLGVAIKDTDNLSEILISYFKNFNIESFNKGRLKYLKQISIETNHFAKKIKEFLTI